MTKPEQPEPWLRGALPDVHAVIAPILRSFEQAREDLARFTEGLTTEQIWERPQGLAPVGFQLRHIAGSVDRLSTYLSGSQLDDAQMRALREEMTPGESRESLLKQLDTVLARAEVQFRAIDPTTLKDARFVGRKQLPTTVAGLLIHTAEHTQRHVGQAIITAKLVRGHS